MNRRLLIALAIILSLLTGLIIYIAQHVERYSRELNTGPRVDVMVNPWFAAQAFLRENGIESHRAFDLHNIINRLKPDDTLILFNESAIYNTRHQQQLRQWMESGGHLIITANYAWEEDEASSGDPFLDEFGVRMTYTGEDEDADEDDDSGVAENANSNTSDAQNGDASDTGADDTAQAAATQCPINTNEELFEVRYNGSENPLQVDFGYSYTLDDASGTASGNADHWPNGVLQYPVGDGLMTVLLETNIWTNRNIGDYDHAFLLWYLASSSPNVWLVASDQNEDLMTLLWRNAAYLIAGLTLMLLIWVWRRSVRFGPQLPDPLPNRRQLLEHIDAESLFCWQHQQMDSMLKTLRDQIWLKLNHQHGIPYHSADLRASALQKLADIAQLPLPQIQAAMSCEMPTRELHWIDLVSQLQTIRNAL